MDLSLQEIFDRARAAQEWIPPTEADLLFAVALRKAVEYGGPLLPQRVVLREGGNLEIDLAEVGAPPRDYWPPELVGMGWPRRPDGRACVYAAGAVAYELFTGLPPPEARAGPGPELSGPLGELARHALSFDRMARLGDLTQLLAAVEQIEPRRSPPEERGLLAALLARVRRWEERAQGAAALAVLREEFLGLAARVATLEVRISEPAAQGGPGAAALEEQVAQLRQQLRTQRAEAERDRLEEPERMESLLALRPPRAPVGTVITIAVISAVLASVATFFALRSLEPEAPPPALQRAPAPPPAAAPPPAPSAEVAAALPTAPGAAPSAAAAGAQPSDAPSTAPAPGAPSPAAPGAAPTPAPSPAALPQAGAPSRPPAAAPSAPLAETAPSAGERSLVAAAKAKSAATPATKAKGLLAKGDAALERGEPGAAVTAFQAALAADGFAAEAHRGLGMAYAIQGDDARAKEEYERYLTAAPGAEDASDIRAAIAELTSRSKLGTEK